MSRGWKSESVDVHCSIVQSDDANGNLEELAEMIYSHFCQLPEDQSAVSETLPKRTGSDD